MQTKVFGVAVVFATKLNFVLALETNEAFVTDTMLEIIRVCFAEVVALRRRAKRVNVLDSFSANAVSVTI